MCSLTPFLDISDKLATLNPFFDERGLLGVAFHPDYGRNGRFFVRYSAPRDGTAGEPCFGSSRGCHAEVLAEYSVSEYDPNVADADSEIILFSVDEPQFNHNSGGVAFGPDGLLYFTLGDGGGANDGFTGLDRAKLPRQGAAIFWLEGYDAGTEDNTERGEDIVDACSALGPVPLAGDPNGNENDAVDSSSPFSIPADNPFVGVDGADEIYAYGLRNPYKFSFDDGPGGDGTLYLADVGQNLFEEINIVENGGNYGWVIREGFSCFDPFNPLNPPIVCPVTGLGGEPLIDPIAAYSHAEGGLAIVGGFVYRGRLSPSLVGTYVFGDFSGGFGVPAGRLYHLGEADGGGLEIREFRIGLQDRPYGFFLKGFGEDECGEVYACGSALLGPGGEEGVVHRIVVVDPTDLRFQARPIEGGQAVPPVDSDATGRAKFQLNGDGTMSIELKVSHIAGVTQAHVHLGARGENGPPVAFLFGPNPGGVSVRGTKKIGAAALTDADVIPLAAFDFYGTVAALADRMLAGTAYVNVHTLANPPGEIRGQIDRVTRGPRHHRRGG